MSGRLRTCVVVVTERTGGDKEAFEQCLESRYLNAQMAANEQGALILFYEGDRDDHTLNGIVGCALDTRMRLDFTDFVETAVTRNVRKPDPGRHFAS